MSLEGAEVTELVEVLPELGGTEAGAATTEEGMSAALALVLLGFLANQAVRMSQAEGAYVCHLTRLQ
jgi:hypothetical protein